MLDLIQVGFDGLSYTYQYFPEGERNSPGEAIVNPSTNEITFSSISDKDKREKYASHAWSRLNSYLKNGEFPQEDIVAWG
ncbi:hypothetical protein ACFFH2_02610 [Enterococcus devriesei]|uniref:hypothetical protein n=1 Tax=Enterococcus devriesei TaxID=319970 RepID=UPI00090009D0|nr:hypothetical protein [Enterococcus devriesei]